MENFKKLIFKTETLAVIGIIAVLVFVFFPEGNPSENEQAASGNFQQVGFEGGNQSSYEEVGKKDTTVSSIQENDRQDEQTGNPNASQHDQLFPGSSKNEVSQENIEDLAQEVEGINVIIATQQRKAEELSSEVLALKAQAKQQEKTIESLKNNLSSSAQKTKMVSDNKSQTSSNAESTSKVSKNHDMSLKEIHGDQAWIEFRGRVYVVSSGDNIGDTKIRKIQENAGQVVTSKGVLD